MRLSAREILALAFRNVYDDSAAESAETNDEGETPETPAPPPANKPKPKAKVALNPEQQEFVNSLLAEERRKAKVSTEKVITQLETLKNQVGTTQAEKDALESRIEDLKNSQLTAEELRKKEEKKKDTKHQTELAVSKAETEKWQKLYTGSTVKRALIEAASKPEHKAHNPSHVVSLLTPDTRLVEELDEDGKPTGELVPRVRVKTVKDGKPAVLEMTATEAVKFLSEQEEHAPLFNSGATGGLGGKPNTPNRRGSGPDDPPTDPAEYQAWRKQNRHRVGTPRR
jgi:hypothetical protein